MPKYRQDTIFYGNCLYHWVYKKVLLLYYILMEKQSFHCSVVCLVL